MQGLYRLIFFLILSFIIAACSSDNKDYAPVVNAWKQPVSKQGGYKVQKGDSLYSIAWSYGVDYQDLAKINHLEAPYHVSPGQTIYLVAHNKSTHSNNYKNKSSRDAVKQKKSLSNSDKNQRLNKWAWPTKGKVISTFSMKKPVNKGIDIQGKNGQTVNAANAGIIVYSGDGISGYGNLIIIKHNKNYLSAYAHNKKNLVKEGQHVSSGQKIASMGQGYLHKSELHFEIRYKGKPINPLKKLPKMTN